MTFDHARLCRKGPPLRFERMPFIPRFKSLGFSGMAYKRALDDLLSGVSILGVEDEICRIFGKERGRLRQTKKMIGDFDLLIASSCLCYNLTLLTNNRRHYEMVGGLKILSAS